MAERLFRRDVQGQYATCRVIVLMTSHMFVSGMSINDSLGKVDLKGMRAQQQQKNKYLIDSAR